MAEHRLHIRPRLGTAMARASDSLVPLAARAMARRQSAGGRSQVGSGGMPESAEFSAAAGPADPIRDMRPEAAATPRGAVYPVREAEQVVREASAGRAVSGEPRDASPGNTSATVRDTGRERPALRLVASDMAPADVVPSPQASGEAQGRSPDPAVQTDAQTETGIQLQSVDAASGSIRLRDALLSRARDAVARRQASGAALPRANADMTVAAAGPRGTPGLAGPGEVPAREHSLSTVSSPRESTDAAKTPWGAERRPEWQMPSRDPERATQAEAEPGRPSPAPSADALANLLIPTLPAAAPTLADQAPAPETDFEFELRVRAALESILSEDLLRHGFIAPEVL